MMARVLVLVAAAVQLAAAPVVREVRLELPEAERRELERHVGLLVGEPLDPEAVRETVGLLYATGRFRDVVAHTQPVGDGVAVILRPERLPRFSGVEIAGDRVISASKAEDAAGLERGASLTPEHLERAARDVALALAGQGYLEAGVSARLQGADDQARVVFDVRSGPRARVQTLELTGVPGSDRLQRSLAPQPGQPFVRERAEATAEQLEQRQHDMGFWRARVEIGQAYDPEAAGVALRFDVVRGPRLSVEFEGEGGSGGLRRRVSEDALAGGLEGDAIDEALDRLEDDLRTRGHRDPVVRFREEARGAERVGIFLVEAGPRTRIASIRFLGDIPEDLVLPATLLQPGEPLDDRRLEEDVKALTDALEARGFARAAVSTDVPEGGGLVPLEFRVEPGPRTLVGSVRIDSPVPMPREQAPGEPPLREGEPYRIRDVARARGALISAHRNAGYLRAEVTPEVSFSEDRTRADVLLRVEPGPRTHVGNIVIAGLERTQERTVRRELTLYEGEPLGFADLLESQRRLGALGIFSRVEIVELNPESTDRRDLLVRVTEAPTVTVAYGLGYSEREKVRASIELTRHNLGGAGRSITAFARGSGKGSRFLVTYREPFLFGRRRELLTSAFREQDDRENFSYLRYGALLQTVVRLTPPEQELRTSLILRYVYQETETFDVVIPCDEVDRQYCSSSVSGPSAAVINDTRDDPLDPRHGHFVSADMQWSAEALGGNSFLKGFLQASLYRRARPKVMLALGARVGLARTFGQGEPLRLPLPERFFAGGAYSLRGFKEDQVTPEGGNAMLLGNAELRIDVSGSFGLATFFDVGNVYPLVSDIDIGDLRYTAGVGLRYETAVGPVRIDWGYKLNRRPDEPKSELHVTIGHAF